MQVPSYQMHNVLNCYCRRLSQNRDDGKQKMSLNKSAVDQISLSEEGKRQATMDRVSKDIYNKITNLDSIDTLKRQNGNPAQPEADTGGDVETEEASQFKFNVIDKINGKMANTLPVEDSQVLIKRLQQLATKTVDKKTESWI